MQEKIAIIGAGRLGKALSKSLLDSGVNLVGIHDLDQNVQETFARKFHIPFFENPYALIEQASTVFLTVPDVKIAQLAQDIVGRCEPGKYYFHCSGAHGLELLAPLREYSHPGCFHPLQSFSGEDSSFKGIYISVDGDTLVCQQAQQIAIMLGATTMQVPSADKALYHAAACILSNYLVTLNVVAENIFAKWNIPKNALEPLLRGSVENIMRLENSKLALTGPIGRGDALTIARHLEVLPAEYRALYTVLGRETCKIARENKTDTDGLEKIVNLLKE